jgi:7-cyano-7-deazaguanine synthase in queuosine biosynthesis
MSGHPENTPEINEMLAKIGKMDVVQIWCKGCEAFRPVNAAYAKYLGGEIESCQHCRKK